MQTGISDISVRNFSTEARNKFRALTALIRHADDSAKLTASAPKTPPPTSAKASPGADTSGCPSCRELRCQKRDVEDNLNACQLKLVSLQSSLRLLDAPASAGELGKRLKQLQVEKDERDNQVSDAVLTSYPFPAPSKCLQGKVSNFKLSSEMCTSFDFVMFRLKD